MYLYHYFKSTISLKCLYSVYGILNLPMPTLSTVKYLIDLCFYIFTKKKTD